MSGEQWGLIEWISFMSFIIGLENLDLNEKQMNDLETHLSKQDEELLSTIIKQNEYIIKQNEDIIKILEDKNAQKADKEND